MQVASSINLPITITFKALPSVKLGEYGGVKQVISVEVAVYILHYKFVAKSYSKNMALSNKLSEKFYPVMVIRVPPKNEPLLGLTLSIFMMY